MTFARAALFTLLLALPLLAQDVIPELAFEPDTATVGDRVQLRLTLPGVAATDSVLWPDVRESLGDLTILSADTLAGKRARQYGGATLLLTVAAFDTGYASTGPLDFEANGAAWTLPSDSVYIASVLTDSTRAELRPLKGQADLEMTLWDWLKYYGPYVAAVVLAALLLWLAWRWWTGRGKKKPADEESIPEPEPYDQARAALAELRADNPLARGAMKEYVSRLVFITKRLLERESGDPVLEMTSMEVRRWLKSRSIPFQLQDMQELLAASDTVKFARGSLDHATAQRLFSVVESIVEAYRPRPENVDSEHSSGPGVRDRSAASPTPIMSSQNPRGGFVGESTQTSADSTEPATWSTSSHAEKRPASGTPPRPEASDPATSSESNDPTSRFKPPGSQSAPGPGDSEPPREEDER